MHLIIQPVAMIHRQGPKSASHFSGIHKFVIKRITIILIQISTKRIHHYVVDSYVLSSVLVVIRGLFFVAGYIHMTHVCGYVTDVTVLAGTSLCVCYYCNLYGFRMRRS
jgi:hypothetical protein